MKKIKIIRDAISHNDFTISPQGYEFKHKKEEPVSFSLEEFKDFLYEIENEFYENCQ